MNVLFLPVTLDGPPATTASYRFRAEWPAKYWREADVYPAMTRPMAEYDAYIFQKAYLVERVRGLIKELRRRKKLLAFDMCDADWELSYEHEQRLLQVLPLFDFVVAPQHNLAGWLRTYVPAHVIPDRLDWAEFTTRRVQSKGKPSLVWFGYSHNIGPLKELVKTIRTHGLDLTIISNKMPEEWTKRGAHFVKWTRHGANCEIVKHDIALVPRVNFWKSINRWVTAWALGLVTATNAKGVEALLDHEARVTGSEELYERARADFDVHQSVEDWKTLLQGYATRRTLCGTASEGE